MIPTETIQECEETETNQMSFGNRYANADEMESVREFTEAEMSVLRFLPTFQNDQGGVEEIGWCDEHGRECVSRLRTGEHLDKAIADSAWSKYLEMTDDDFDPFADEDPFGDL